MTGSPVNEPPYLDPLCESDAPRGGEEDSTTKNRRHTTGQAIRELAKEEKLLNEEQGLADVIEPKTSPRPPAIGGGTNTAG